MPKAAEKKKKSGKKGATRRAKAVRGKKVTQRKKVTQSRRRKAVTRLTQAAVAIGSILGKADSAAHKAASVVKKEASQISDQVKDALS